MTNVSDLMQIPQSRQFPAEWYDLAPETHFWTVWRSNVIVQRTGADCGQLPFRGREQRPNRARAALAHLRSRNQLLWPHLGQKVQLAAGGKALVYLVKFLTRHCEW